LPFKIETGVMHDSIFQEYCMSDVRLSDPKSSGLSGEALSAAILDKLRTEGYFGILYYAEKYLPYVMDMHRAEVENILLNTMKENKINAVDYLSEFMPHLSKEARSGISQFINDAWKDSPNSIFNNIDLFLQYGPKEKRKEFIEYITNEITDTNHGGILLRIDQAYEHLPEDTKKKFHN